MSDTLDDFIEAFQDAPELLLEAAETGLRRGAHRFAAQAKANVHVDTGQLRNSITTDVQREEGRVIATVSANAEYAVFEEMGTGPRGEANHAGIDPEAKPTYRSTGWVYMSEDGPRYTKGRPAHPYMYPALQATKDDIRKDVTGVIQGMIQKGGEHGARQ